jgi:hypothetical protein
MKTSLPQLVEDETADQYLLPQAVVSSPISVPSLKKSKEPASH